MCVFVRYRFTCDVMYAKNGLDRLCLTSPKSHTHTLIGISNFSMCQNQRTITAHTHTHAHTCTHTQQKLLSKPFGMDSLFLLSFDIKVTNISKRSFCEFSILINTNEQCKFNVSDVFSLSLLIPLSCYREFTPINPQRSQKCVRVFFSRIIFIFISMLITMK